MPSQYYQDTGGFGAGGPGGMNPNSPDLLGNTFPGFNLTGSPASFSAVAPGVPQGVGGNPFDRMAYGAMLQAALSRGQLSGGLQRAMQGYQGIENPLLEQMGRVNQFDVAGELASSAIGSTTNATSSALEAARRSGGGGGFSRQLAMRGATDAAVGQSGAVANALVQGRLSKLQMQGGLAGALTDVNMGRAGALSELNTAESQLSFNIAQMLAGLAQPGSQVAAAQIGRAAGREQGWMGLAGQLATQGGGGGGGGGGSSMLGSFTW